MRQGDVLVDNKLQLDWFTTRENVEQKVVFFQRLAEFQGQIGIVLFELDAVDCLMIVNWKSNIRSRFDGFREWVHLRGICTRSWSSSMCSRHAHSEIRRQRQTGTETEKKTESSGISAACFVTRSPLVLLKFSVWIGGRRVKTIKEYRW